MRKKVLLFCCTLLFISSISYAQPFKYVVSLDGTGTHSSVQQAIDDCPDNERCIIFIKNGTYNEKVSIGARNNPSNKQISLIGESAEGVVITSSEYRNSQGSFYDIVTFQVYAKDFYAENLTIENAAGNVGQAEALFNGADRQTFKNCRILGYQDTHRSNKGARCYFKDCWIEGAVDFIYAGGVIFFDDCTINCVKGGGYIVAPEDCIKNIRKTDTATGKFLHIGFFFRNCNITANDDVAEATYYLGRPWKENAGAYYINCLIDKHIKPEGWREWSGNETTATFGEYNSKDMQGNPLDVSKRVNWSMQLPEEDIDKLFNPEYIYNWIDAINPYEPLVVCTPASKPDFLSANGKELVWAPVQNAMGYVLYKDGKFLDAVSTTNYLDVTEGDGIYSIKSISSTGALSEAVFVGDVSVGEDNLSDWNITISDNNIAWGIEASAGLYDLYGNLKEVMHGTQMNVSHIDKGVYILKLNDKNFKKPLAKKVIIK